jgi:hypothetical protein
MARAERASLDDRPAFRGDKVSPRRLAALGSDRDDGMWRQQPSVEEGQQEQPELRHQGARGICRPENGRTGQAQVVHRHARHTVPATSAPLFRAMAARDRPQMPARHPVPLPTIDPPARLHPQACPQVHGMWRGTAEFCSAATALHGRSCTHLPFPILEQSASQDAFHSDGLIGARHFSGARES